MTLHDLVVKLRESGTSEHKLTVLRQIAKTLPEGASLDMLVDQFAAHHNVSEGTIVKAKAILRAAADAAKLLADAKAAGEKAGGEVARPVPPPQSTRK